jgi:hypothetical protein
LNNVINGLEWYCRLQIQNKDDEVQMIEVDFRVDEENSDDSEATGQHRHSKVEKRELSTEELRNMHGFSLVTSKAPQLIQKNDLSRSQIAGGSNKDSSSSSSSSSSNDTQASRSSSSMDVAP